MGKVTTQTGFTVSVHICNKAYATGRKVAVKDQMEIIFDEELSQWSQRSPAKPEA